MSARKDNTEKLVVTQRISRSVCLATSKKNWATKCSCPGQQMRYSWGTSSFSPSPSRFRLLLSLPLSLDTFFSRPFLVPLSQFPPIALSSFSSAAVTLKMPPQPTRQHSAAGRGIRQKDPRRQSFIPRGRLFLRRLQWAISGRTTHTN